MRDGYVSVEVHIGVVVLVRVAVHAVVFHVWNEIWVDLGAKVKAGLKVKYELDLGPMCKLD